MLPSHPDFPRHDDFNLRRRVFEAACVGAAALLLAWQVGRLVATVPFQFWLLLPLVAGLIGADFVSGLAHWTADTWGAETMPVLGRRFLRPFRVHHVNPDDFLRRRFLDVNGDVAMIVVPLLAGVLWIPLHVAWGQALAVLIVSFCAAGAPTNQVHQWAHLPCPPRWVDWLQRRHVILSREAHSLHHRAPYAMNYCIATGWCNGPLTRLDFFRRAERTLMWLTGLVPRHDDTLFQTQVEQMRLAQQAAPNREF